MLRDMFSLEVSMRNKVMLSLAVVVILGGVAAYSLAFASTQRAECPGKVICPLTGEQVCKDQCPLLDPERADCPGKIECPLTGELVCRDQCPLAAKTTADEGTKPLCCQCSK